MPIFGARKRAQELDEENAWLRQQLAALGALDHIELARQRDDLARQRGEIAAQVEAKRQELDRLAVEIVATSDLAVLQEVGVYQYRHPLENAEQYKAARERISEQIKAMVRNGQAIEAATSWTVNNSAAQGRAMVRDLSKLMLRAYNAEAENCVRTMRAGNLSVAVKRLEKAVWAIAKLGKIMSIRVAPAYHQLRIQELELVADYQAKLAEEKEAERAERERLREEAKARREYEQEQERLTKELDHYRNALAAVGDGAGAGELQAKIDEIERSIEGVQARAANIRAAQHAGHLLDFVEEPEASEWRQSEGERQRSALVMPQPSGSR